MSMNDLRERLGAADRVSVPDLWPEIITRQPREPPKSRHVGRFLMIGAVIALTAAAIGLLIHTFGVDRNRPAEAPHDEIAFVRSAGTFPTHASMYVAHPDGSGLRKISPEFRAVGRPSWSPDGSKLAFAASNDDSGSQIYVMNADGSHLHQVSGIDGANPVWAPDGTKLAFELPVRDGRGGLMIINEDGTDPRPLHTESTKSEFMAQDPAWSPDGQTIYFIRSLALIDGPALLFRLDVASEEVRRLYPAASGAYWVAWSSDGSRYATGGPLGGGSRFCSNRVIEIRNVDGSGKRTLRAPLLDCPDIIGASWTPDGSGLLFWTEEGIYEINPDGTGFRQLIADPTACCAAWRPTPKPARTTGFVIRCLREGSVAHPAPPGHIITRAEAIERACEEEGNGATTTGIDAQLGWARPPFQRQLVRAWLVTYHGWTFHLHGPPGSVPCALGDDVVEIDAHTGQYYSSGGSGTLAPCPSG
jgi:Tol biopolymer transport system component